MEELLPSTVRKFYRLGREVEHEMVEITNEEDRIVEDNEQNGIRPVVSPHIAEFLRSRFAQRSESQNASMTGTPARANKQNITTENPE